MARAPLRLRVGDDVDIAAYPSGPASERPAAVLLHGIGMSHLTWAALQPRLARTSQVISFDLPGFGVTGKPSQPFGVDDFADAVDAALTTLGIGPCVVVGHSMGAQFAVELAARRPERVSGLVLIGPVVDPIRRGVVAQARDLAVDSLREPPRVNARVFTDYARGGPVWYLSTLRAMLAYRIEQRIRRTRCPVVVMRGQRDPVARQSWCQALADSAPAAGTVVTVAGKAHVIPLTAVEAVRTVVSGLVAAAGPPPDQ